MCSNRYSTCFGTLRQSLLIAVVLALAVAEFAGQTTGVDLAFAAVPSTALTTGTNVQQIVQPDGKVVVFGTKLVVDGVAKSDVVRLNPDGTGDPTFAYCGCGLGAVRNLMLAPDGKLIVAGTSESNAKMIRLHTDGSIDGSFTAIASGPPPFFGGAEFIVNAVQPDGKVLATTRFSSMGFVSYTLRRYNVDGTVDSSFSSIAIASGSPMAAFVKIGLLPDGRFYLAVTAGVTGSGATLTRRNPDGTVDSTWETPSFQTGGFPPATAISGLAVTPDGGVLVAGRWETVNGLTRRNLVRLQAGGNVDLNFSSPAALAGIGVELLPDGKIYFSGTTDVSGIHSLFRLNSDGTADSSFSMDPRVTSILNSWSVDSSQRVVFLAQTAVGIRMVRLLSNGTLDPAFNPNLTLFGSVHLMARQADGRILLAGMFTQLNGSARNNFGRVHPDGSLDPTFDPGTGFDTPPSRFAIQADGKIIAVGDFTSYNGLVVPGIVRINTNGSFDNTFNVTVNSNPMGVSIQADGKILISGSFSNVNGSPRTGVARIDANGVLDATFNPTIGSPQITTIIAQTDGKVLIGGSFVGINGFNRSNLARLNNDGSLDQSFLASGVGSVGNLWLQPDGKYLIGHGFTPTSLTRRNIDGSADPTFTAPGFAASSSGDTHIHAVVIQADGSLIVGGRFDTVGQASRPNITRLAPNGAHDVLFMPAGANGRVRSIIADGSSRVLLGGNFNVIGNVPRPGIAGLNVSPYRGRTPYDFDGDGRADYTVYRPSSGVWYELSSGTGTYDAPVFGLNGDIPVPADFDGDGRTDEAIFRPANGDWWYQSSVNGAHVTAHYGVTGDVPRPGDFDGDGKADFIVFRPSTNTWYRSGSTVGGVIPLVFGIAGDQPLVGDFDGDGRVDPAIFRPSTGDWWYAASSASGQHRSIHWGATGDIPAPADFDGDGKTDFAVFRPSNGAWYIFKSSDQSYIILGFGLSGDRPVPADYDGDGRADIAVYRPSTGIWYVLQSTSGTAGVQWGVSSDVAAPNAFLP